MLLLLDCCMAAGATSRSTRFVVVRLGAFGTLGTIPLVGSLVLFGLLFPFVLGRLQGPFVLLSFLQSPFATSIETFAKVPRPSKGMGNAGSGQVQFRFQHVQQFPLAPFKMNVHVRAKIQSPHLHEILHIGGNQILHLVLFDQCGRRRRRCGGGGGGPGRRG